MKITIAIIVALLASAALAMPCGGIGGMPPCSEIPATPISQDPGMHNPCTSGPAGIIPQYLSGCGLAPWRIEPENSGVGILIYEAETHPDGTWTAVLSALTGEPMTDDFFQQWTGLSLMQNVYAQTSRNLWLTGRFLYSQSCCSSGDNRGTAMFIGVDADTGHTFEVDVNFAGHWTGRPDAAPGYIVNPEPYPNGLDSWVVLDGRAWRLWAQDRIETGLDIPITAILEQISERFPETFPAPACGWANGGAYIYAWGIGDELYRESWSVLRASQMTMWSGKPTNEQFEVPQAHFVRKHLTAIHGRGIPQGGNDVH